MNLEREFHSLRGVLGLDLLALFYRHYWRDNGRWIPLNVQPARIIEHESRMKHIFDHVVQICPHYILLETIAEMLCISPDELGKMEHFCGHVSISQNDDRYCGIGEKRLGFYKIPISCCRVLHDMLGLCINFLKSEEPEPIFVDSQSTAEKIEEAGALLLSWKEFKTSQTMHGVLLKSIPTVFPTRPAKKDRAAVAKFLEQILSRLKEQVTGSEDELLWGGLRCVQAPKLD